MRTAILTALAQAPDGVSLAKLCKRLDVRMSVLLRTLAWMGETPIGSTPGEALVRVETHGERVVAMLVRSDNAIARGEADGVP